MKPAEDLFPDFEKGELDTRSVRLFFRRGGSGPPLLLLHGYPQTHVAWHKVAGALAERFTVVAPDLRGYGRSSCPPDDGEHRAYSKRTMAADMVKLMDALGFNRYAVMGHDRGGRVAYRLALDHPQCVERLVALDTLTTWDQWKEQTTHHRIVHWAFLAQPAPIPETLIGSDPVDWVEGRLKRGTRERTLDSFDPRALADYRESLSDREDFRASASCDIQDDEADLILGRRIVGPMLVLWGLAGNLEDIGDPIASWRAWCPNVSGYAINCGHFIPEEDPAALLAAVVPFLLEPEVPA